MTHWPRVLWGLSQAGVSQQETINGMDREE
jgi:hypothetical protein